MAFISNSQALENVLLTKLDPCICKDVLDGLEDSTMSIKLSQHILSLINWKSFKSDPIRRQFLPLFSEVIPDHPKLILDSLGEKKNAHGQRIIHRYPNKILFLASKICDTYCAFCTRSYLVGSSTAHVKKIKQLSSIDEDLLYLENYLKTNTNIFDVVISGGDINTVSNKVLIRTLELLLNLDQIRSVRLGSRILTFNPTSLNPDTQLFETIVHYSHSYQKKLKELSLQVHFNHVNEISPKTEENISYLYKNFVKLRNQTVLLDKINNEYETLINLFDKLIKLGVQPYYVYQMDMVKRTEHFRTSIKNSIDLEKSIQGVYPGFLTPKFIVDLPGGGGKVSVSNFYDYDKEQKCYLYHSSIKPSQTHKYYDPIKTEVLNDDNS